ncbi:MAG: PilW family protein [Burkholderiaceae bacterium]
MQRGVTLIELMIGIAIGLVVVAVATIALMASRGVSGTVSDASDIQQQASYAMRVIGQQLRQGGSLYLNLNSSGAATANILTAPVAFETKVAGSAMQEFDPATDTLSGTNNTLTVGYRRYQDLVFTSTSPQSLVRNCIGSEGAAADQRLESAFSVNGTELRCAGNGSAAQPVVENVANFQVRYALQDTTSVLGSPQIKYAAASEVGTTDWPKVQGVEVCLVLFGTEPIDMPVGTSYTDCDGTTQVDMTTLTGARTKRMHLVFRNVFQVRSQGLVGTVL